MIDYDAPGRKTGLLSMFQRLRCGGRYRLSKGHTPEWKQDGRIAVLRCRECGHILDLEDTQAKITEYSAKDDVE